MKEAKVFKSGNSQAIRIPKEYQIDTDTVKINRVGNLLIIIPEDTPEWEMFKEGISEAVDFPEVHEIPIPNPTINLE